jgi:cytochrome c-type biogenesis protein CcmH/NrfG
MGWLTMILLTLALAAGLYPFVRRDKGALQFLIAALLLALAGYSWQGKPDRPGAPKAAQAREPLPDDDFTILHPDLLGRFDRAYSWMMRADADRRDGNLIGSAQTLEAAVRNHPRSYSLWIAYAYALVAAGDGLMSPAAQLAFDRASQLAPNHPGPLFFYGLALARGNNWDQAEQVWRGQLQELGPNQPLYRAALEERLAAIQQARSTGTAVRPATPLPQRQGQGAPTAAPGGEGENGNAAAPAPAGNSTDQPLLEE